MHSTYFSSFDMLGMKTEFGMDVRFDMFALSTPLRSSWYFSPLFTLYTRMRVPLSDTVASNEPSSAKSMLRSVLS